MTLFICTVITGNLSSVVSMQKCFKVYCLKLSGNSKNTGLNLPF